jgi:broad specificity phosphatase PhoE
MRILVARHAETNYNVRGIVNYEPEIDVHLTENGIAQAHKLAAELKDIPINLIFVSRLKRTKQTADIINQLHNAPIIEDARLDDVRSGFEGKSVFDAKAWRQSQPDPLTAKISPEYESVQDVNARTRSFLADLINRSEKNVLIVTSSHVVKHFRIINENHPTTNAFYGTAPNAKYYEMYI